MRRIVTEARPNWQKTVEAQGFTFHSNGVKPDYIKTWGTNWYEGAYYEFQTKDYEALSHATLELNRLCLQAVQQISRSKSKMYQLGIPEAFHDTITRTVNENHPTLYGRMDLAYDGTGPAKLLEYNADTPTTLIESSVVQWNWLEEKFTGKLDQYDQFNSIHDDLIAKWADLAPSIDGEVVYFATNQESIEEFATTEYLRDVAYQANVNSAFINMADLGWNGEYFTDLDENAINFMFKLYPWEWMVREDFGKFIPSQIHLGVLEPIWKMILSNKGILPILWEMFPDHPNLLPAFWDKPKTGNFVEKPILSREGQNIIMREGDKIIAETHGTYALEPKIYQQTFQLPKFDDQYAVIGSWVIGDKSSGIIMREDDTPIIIDRSRVVPHVFV